MSVNIKRNARQQPDLRSWNATRCDSILHQPEILFKWLFCKNFRSFRTGLSAISLRNQKTAAGTFCRVEIKKAENPIAGISAIKPMKGLEPLTYALRMRCSTFFYQLIVELADNKHYILLINLSKNSPNGNKNGNKMATKMTTATGKKWQQNAPFKCRSEGVSGLVQASLPPRFLSRHAMAE